MKIALLHYRLILRGGLETRLLNYLKRFHQLGHEVTVICAKRDPDIALPQGVQVIRVKLGLMPKPFRPWYFSQLSQAVLNASTYDYVLSLGRTGQQDAVLMPGGHLGFLEAMGRWKSSISDWMQIHLDRVAYRNSQLIFAASKMMQTELIQKYAVDANKIKLLYPPLNTQRFNQALRPERSALRDAFQLQAHQLAFAFVSTSHYRKGLDILLKVFKNLDTDRYQLLIVGKPRVKSRLKNVRFLGFLEDPRSLYTAADFMILPARYEPFGQVVTESLQCGTPVLISDRVGAKDVVGPKEGVILPSLDPQVWTTKIQQLQPEAFSIDPQFAEQKRLSLDDHVDTLLREWQQCTM
ncbi:MAG: glycosyltransferase family 4 protein [Bacteroidota bacterium]